MSDNITWEKNLKALQQHHPELAAQILATPEMPAISLVKKSAEPSFEFEIALSFSDGAVRPYHGGHSPAAFSHDLIRRLDLKNPRVLIFLGVGLGLHLLEYAKHPHPLTRGVMIFEAFPQIFKKALEVTDLTTLLQSPAFHWCIGQDTQTVSRFFARFFETGNHLSYANAIEYIPLPPAVEMSVQFYQEVQTLLPQAIGHQFNRFFGDGYDAFLGIKNTLDNLEQLITMPAMRQTDGLFNKRPGIIIASGPSLTESLPFLKIVLNRAVMAACPSALPTLLAEKIQPHIQVNIERLEELGHFFEGLQKSPHVFVAPPLVHPRCFSGNGGDNAYVLGKTLTSSWLPLDGPALDLGHSSAHAAFRILQSLGCDPILLVGQDLSYSESSSHAAGVWEESQRLMMNLKEKDQKIFEIEGNNGKPVKTNLFFFTYWKTFCEQLIPEFSGQVYNVIPESFGAKIPGTTRLDPAELSTLLGEEFPVLDLLRKTLSLPSPEDQKKKKKLLLEKLGETEDFLSRLRSESKKFSLACKALQFDQNIIAKKWDRAEPDYKNFLNKIVEPYFSRFSNAENEKDRSLYFDFFRPIVQGLLLRYQIEYFSSAQDLAGDFGEITRKTEILFHMAKDQLYWADVISDELQKARQRLHA